MNSKNRILLWLALAMLPGVLLFGAGMWATEMARGQVLSLTLNRVAEQARSQYRDTINRIRFGIAAPERAQALRGDITAERCRELLAPMVAGDQAKFLAMAFVDAQGRVMCDTDSVTNGRDLSANATFLAARNNPAFAFNGVRVPNGAALPTVSISVPVVVDGQFRGVILADVSLQGFDTLARRLGGDTEIAIGFVAPDGQAYLADQRGGEFLPPQAQLARLLGAKQSSDFSQGRDSLSRLYARAVLQEDRLYLVAGAPGEPLPSFLETYGAYLPLGAVLLHLLAFTAFGIGLYYVILRPLLAIQRRAQAVEAGSPSDAQLGHAAGTELKELGRALSSVEQQLQQQRTALAAAEQRHTKAMREIHHRIKNNLQIVSSLLSLQATRLKVPAGRADFDMARQRLSALALLHRHLYDGGDFHTIELRSFCSDLVEHLRELAGYERTAQIRTHFNLPPVSVSADQAVLLALIITETVTNAFRHAFPGGRPGNIEVGLSLQGALAKLSISDDGVGLPEGRLASSGANLGGLLIAGFVRQLRGTLNISSEGGTRLEIEFPLDRPAAA